MFSTSDTIVAIATPPGRGGIGVVRLSGPDAHAIAQRLIAREAALEPRHATLARVVSGSSRPRGGGARRTIDDVIVTYFPSPHSYTGEHVVEVSAHGSPVVLREIVTMAVDAGARLAEPGEFTLRAFLNGRLDLPQAEAVADLIEAATPLQARAACDQLQGTVTRDIAAIESALFDVVARLEASIDFPDEGYHFIEPSAVADAIDDVRARTARLIDNGRRGRLIREGVQVAIVGRPNVGKSSLFNALVGVSRAIVTDVPGTTRDLITEVADVDGVRVTFVDTAGLRVTHDAIEREGVERATQSTHVSELILYVADRSQPWTGEDQRILEETGRRRLLVANKSDLPAAWTRNGAVEVSAVTGDGIDRLRLAIARALDVEALADPPAITNVRHLALIERAHAALEHARTTAEQLLPEELVLADLQDARSALEEVTGRRAPEELLAHIFARFCVGK